jgi:hypothetical protein
MSDQNERDLLVALEKVRGKPPSRGLLKLNVCGDIGLKIARDGTWSYQGSPIGRKPLVKLFASVLRKEEDGFYLSWTSSRGADRGGGHVFRAVEMWAEGSGKDRRLVPPISTKWLQLTAHQLGFEGATGGFVPFIVVRTVSPRVLRGRSITIWAALAWGRRTKSGYGWRSILPVPGRRGRMERAAHSLTAHRHGAARSPTGLA